MQILRLELSRQREQQMQKPYQNVPGMFEKQETSEVEQSKQGGK